MSVISIRLPDHLLHNLDNMAKVVHLQRAEYIRCAIEKMNLEILNHEKKIQLEQASLKVRQESMRINQEFSDIEHDQDL